MAMTDGLSDTRTRSTGLARQWSGAVIDCDLSPVVPSVEALFPYQDELWVQWTEERGWSGPKVPAWTFPPNAPTTVRAEWRPEKGLPASEVELVREHVLDPWNLDLAVLTPYYGVDALRHPDWAAALARAVNDWVIDQWLDRDPRLRASITVPARDPAAAIAEIERVGDHPGFVQVLMPVRSGRLYGQREHHPIFEAIARHDLVLGLHWGGTVDDAPTTSGWPSWYIEEYTAEIGVYMAQILSLVAEGVFQKVPDLRVAVLDSGFAWLPSWGWRMNAEWKGLRREVPWVEKLPFDLIREHFRFSIAPLDAGPAEEMEQIVDWLGSEDLLMFGSDYPHRHDDDLGAFLDLLSESMRTKVMAETARDWYRL
jgi:predicted TIM-barrel fold metal-dependent hydrolase